MTRITRTRSMRRQLGAPPQKAVSSLHVDQDKRQLLFVTKTMIINQLERDGPRIRRSFDKLARADIKACSELFGETQGLSVRHLPRLADEDFKATVSRLLNSAASTYLASIEVARHGYRRQYGMLARTFIETIATVIALAIRPTALEEFHAGTLRSTKCIGWAKDVLPPLGRYYGMLSEEFVHVGLAHAGFDPISLYGPDDAALEFILGSMRGNVWLLYLTAELVFQDEIEEARYWKPNGAGLSYDPSPEEREWMANFLGVTGDVAPMNEAPAADN